MPVTHEVLTKASRDQTGFHQDLCMLARLVDEFVQHGYFLSCRPPLFLPSFSFGLLLFELSCGLLGGRAFADVDPTDAFAFPDVSIKTTLVPRHLSTTTYILYQVQTSCFYLSANTSHAQAYSSEPRHACVKQDQD